MSWTPSSKGLALVVLLAATLALVGPAAAISVTDSGVPAEAQVGGPVNATVTVEDPFVDMPDTWTLQAATDLQNVSWTITVLQQGEKVNQETYGSQEVSQELDGDNGGDTVQIDIEGDAPPVDSWSYEPRETFTLYDIDQVTGSNEQDLNETSLHHYTNQSQDARTQIDAAADAINETGGNQKAKNQLNRSISAYDAGNFDNAMSLANSAQDEAEQAEQSAQQTQLLIYGAVGLIALVIIGGGIYYWRSQQDDYGKLQ